MTCPGAQGGLVGQQFSQQGRMLTVMDHLLLAPNASHVTSSPIVARDGIPTLTVI